MKTASTLKFPIVLLLALLIISAMFTLLQNLTTSSFTIVPVKPVVIDWKRVLVDTPVEVKQPPKPELIPPPLITGPILPPGGEVNPGERRVKIDPINPPTDLGNRKDLGNAYDRDVVPALRVDPDYPLRARSVASKAG